MYDKIHYNKKNNNNNVSSCKTDMNNLKDVSEDYQMDSFREKWNTINKLHVLLDNLLYDGVSTHKS